MVLLIVLVVIAVIGILMTALSASMRSVRQASEANAASAQFQSAIDCAVEELLQELNDAHDLVLPKTTSIDSGIDVKIVQSRPPSGALNQALEFKIQADFPVARREELKRPSRVLWAKIVVTQRESHWRVTHYEILSDSN
jgi:type II secretory pathway pseudopilin PulG